MEFLTIVGEVGFPIAGAIAAGLFVFTTLKFILASVTGGVCGLKNIIKALDNRVQTMNNDLVQIDAKVSHVLALEQLQFTRSQDIKKKQEREAKDALRDEANEVINKFIANVESRIYANLSKQLVDNMFSSTGASTGTAELEGATIFWERDVDLGTIAIRITEIDGTVTTVTVPVGDFGF